MSDELRAKLAWPKERPDRRRPGDENRVKFVFEMTLFGLALPWPRVRAVHKNIGRKGETERLMLRILDGAWEGSTQAKVGFVGVIFLMWVNVWSAAGYEMIMGSQDHYRHIRVRMMERLFKSVFHMEAFSQDVAANFYEMWSI
jgi:hypothetical protein